MKIENYLKDLKISFKIYHHRPVFTVEEAKEIEKNFKGIKTKNLFLRDKKKKNYYLISSLAEKRVNLKKLKKDLKVDKLSFASPFEVEKFLKVKPGSISPFNLINDLKKKVILIIDKEILKDKWVNFHPNDNSKTLNLKTKDFIKYLNSLENKVIFLKIKDEKRD